MGLTNRSTGFNVMDSALNIEKRSADDIVIALAGNPNVGKSTVFNALTGMKQHTGNWPGKTVSVAQGFCLTASNSYVLVDIPGTYSLMAHSSEEEIARDFIFRGGAEATVVVCDASCLERSLNLVLQILEISSKVLVCVNLMDEAERKNITLDLPALSERLGVPVVGITARKKSSLPLLTKALDALVSSTDAGAVFSVRYPEIIEQAISIMLPAAEQFSGKTSPRWLSLRLLDGDDALLYSLEEYLGRDTLGCREIIEALEKARQLLDENGITSDKFQDLVASASVKAAEEICAGVVTYPPKNYNSLDRRLDRLLTSRLTGFPVMLCLLAAVFYLTVTAANYPSQILSSLLFALQDKLSLLFEHLGAPDWLHGLVVSGAYRVLAWVVSVMLPPMAIFFPLFTILEDAGYLPRVAYNLDKPFQRCSACGKQALTMCMGFGCNAAGVVGCRIIDSPRERLLAILTNSFVPCNGRFPALISILTMFFLGGSSGALSSLLTALMLTGVILLGIGMTFAVTKLLSCTLLKGMPSSFTLELPPYRLPQFGKVIVRSVFDRTLFVLGRAAAVAAPAGVLIWLMANVVVGGESLLNHFSAFLDPFARLMGLDGVILMAFILGFPANEIVIPIIIMAYTAQGSLTEPGSLMETHALFLENGWTWITAGSTVLFSLTHWPCSTTLLTVKKETGSWKWTALAAAIPTATGIIACILFANIARLFA